MISLLFVLINVLLAWIDSKKILKNLKIQHGANGAVYFLLVGATYWITRNIWLLPCLLLIRKVVFDIALNLFRKLPAFHVSTTTTSIIDRIHNKVFGDHALYYQAIYGAGVVLMNLFLI